MLFQGMDVVDAFPFRVTRNANVGLANDDVEDLSDVVAEELRLRRVAEVCLERPAEAGDRVPVQVQALEDDRRARLEGGGDPVNLNAGDRIKQTQSAVVLENLISQFLFNKAAEEKDTKK